MTRRLLVVSVLLVGLFGLALPAQANECVVVDLPTPTGRFTITICNDIPGGDGGISVIDYIFIEVDPNSDPDLHVSLLIGGRAASIVGTPGVQFGFNVIPPEGGGICVPSEC